MPRLTSKQTEVVERKAWASIVKATKENGKQIDALQKERSKIITSIRVKLHKEQKARIIKFAKGLKKSDYVNAMIATIGDGGRVALAHHTEGRLELRNMAGFHEAVGKHNNGDLGRIDTNGDYDNPRIKTIAEEIKTIQAKSDVLRNQFDDFMDDMILDSDPDLIAKLKAFDKKVNGK